jgi:ribosomal-protein-alanine N-acetyltransferase
MSAVMAPQVRIQPLGEGDLDALVEIEREIYEFPWTLGNFRDSLRAGYSCWGLFEDRRLIGYAVLMLAAGEGHLLNLSVAASMQRRGHGARLLAHLIRVARDYGARVLFLEVRPSNEPAQRLYAAQGFHTIGVRRGYYPARDGREDAIVLSLPL